MSEDEMLPMSESGGSGHPTALSVTVEEKTDLTNADRNVAEETSSSLEDDWENDSANPRNWSMGQKWWCTAIVNAMAS